MISSDQYDIVQSCKDSVTQIIILDHNESVEPGDLIEFSDERRTSRSLTAEVVGSVIPFPSESKCKIICSVHPVNVVKK